MKIFTLIAITAGASVGILVVSFFSYNKYYNEDASSFLRHHRSRLGLVYDPRTTVLKPPLEQLPKCPLRNLAAFKNGRVGRKYFDAVPKTLEGSNCLFFDCTNDVIECDNGNPTNYDGFRVVSIPGEAGSVPIISDNEEEEDGTTFVPGVWLKYVDEEGNVQRKVCPRSGSLSDLLQEVNDPEKHILVDDRVDLCRKENPLLRD